MSIADHFRTPDARSEPWVLAALAVAVGVAAAAVAVVLRAGVHLLFEQLSPLRGEWYGIFLPAFGAMAGVFIIRKIFKEPGGHGVPAVLAAVTRGGGHMRRRSIVSRLCGSLVNVSFGGSAGLEGPIVFSSAAVGSTLAERMGVGERQRVMLLACGVAAGIGAIFNAPLTGMIFAMEVVLAEWTLGAMLPIAVAATVATEIGRQAFGAQAAFATETALDWTTQDLGPVALLGAAAGLVSVALVTSIFTVEHWTRKIKDRMDGRSRGFVAGGVGLLVGLIGWLAPGAIGEGYSTVHDAVAGHLPVGGVLVLLLLAKLVATALTLGSNAPGGIFAPSLVLGAVLGYGFGTLIEVIFPAAGFAEPRFFALAAMAGLVAGSMMAPITGILLALETTGGYEGTLPLILVASVSTLVSRTLLRHSFYTWELAERGELLRPGTDRRILSELRASEILDGESVQIESGSSLDDLAKLLPKTTRNHFAVVDGEGVLLGMLDLTALRGVIFDDTVRRVTPVDTVMDVAIERLPGDDSLLQAIDAFTRSGAWVLPVVDAEGKFLGTVSKSTIFDRYRSELIVQTADRGE